jgi:hypothetical protein
MQLQPFAPLRSTAMLPGRVPSARFLQKADYKSPEFDLEFILSQRKFTNIFEIRKAVQTATLAQLETAQFIWKTICRVIGQLWPEETPAELGLTTARQFQGAFGPMVLSIIVVSLQPRGHAAFNSNNGTPFCPCRGA